MTTGMIFFSRQLIHGVRVISSSRLTLCNQKLCLRSCQRQLSSLIKHKMKFRENPVIDKLDSSEFRALFSPELKILEDTFKKYGYEIRIAGGAVRDLLMRKTPKDLDFATVATPDQMREMFTQEGIRMINQRGESHGTITARINDKENFEVTTLRIDVVTDGRHATTVQFTEDWLLDANRRDLTINSMFLGFDGTVYDYFYGSDHLRENKVVFVGNAEDRIREDYLRILRYFRFFGRITTDPERYEKDVIEVIKANASGLERISGERIWMELRLILSGNYGPLIFEKMLSIGLSPYIGLPQEPNTKELRTLTERTKGVKLNPATYLAAVINNMSEALALNTRLKMSAYERELICFVVEHRKEKLCPRPLLPFEKLMLQTKFKVSDVREWCMEVLMYNGQFDLAKEFEKWEMPKFPIKGTDLKDHVTQSKQIAQLVKKLKDHWAEENYQTSTEELIGLVPKFLEEIGVETAPTAQRKKK